MRHHQAPCSSIPKAATEEVREVVAFGAVPSPGAAVPGEPASTAGTGIQETKGRPSEAVMSPTKEVAGDKAPQVDTETKTRNMRRKAIRTTTTHFDNLQINKWRTRVRPIRMRWHHQLARRHQVPQHKAAPPPSSASLSSRLPNRLTQHRNPRFLRSSTLCLRKGSRLENRKESHHGSHHVSPGTREIHIGNPPGNARGTVVTGILCEVRRLNLHPHAPDMTLDMIPDMILDTILEMNLDAILEMTHELTLEMISATLLMVPGWRHGCAR